MTKDDYDLIIGLASLLYEIGEKDLATDLMARLLIYKIGEVVYNLCKGDDK